MSLTIQNLRAVGAGVTPASLLPGQLCFNVTDEVMFVGDGSSTKKSFDGTDLPGVPGGGWYSMAMNFDSLANFFVANPAYYGDPPSNSQLLAWSSTLDHPIWQDASVLGKSNVYVTTNADVDAAAGITVTEKIDAVLGVVPVEADSVIVTGVTGDTYQGLYIYTGTTWQYAASYAPQTAQTVAYDNSSSPIPLPGNVQGAIDTLEPIALTASSTATSALTVASAAIPKSTFLAKGNLIAGTGPDTFLALPLGPSGSVLTVNPSCATGLEWAGGGTTVVASVTGILPVSVNNTNPSAPIVSVNPATLATSGVVTLNNSVGSTSDTQAATPSAVKTAYDLAANALPFSGGTLTGPLVAQNIQIQAGYHLQFNAPYPGLITGITDSVILVDSDVAASAAAVKTTYDLASNALPLTGGTMTGDIVFNNGQPVDAGTF